MLTRRSFLRALGGAALALGLRKAPKAESREEDIAFLVDKTVDGVNRLAHTEEFTSREWLPYLGQQAQIWDDAWIVPMRAPTQQEYDKWRAQLEDLCAQTTKWLKDMNANA